jgi:iodotyrosine deiodinase
VEYPAAEMMERAESFYEELRRRRTVRHFSNRPVPRDVIECCLLTAGTAPNGANPAITKKTLAEIATFV